MNNSRNSDVLLSRQLFHQLLNIREKQHNSCSNDGWIGWFFRSFDSNKTCHKLQILVALVALVGIVANSMTPFLESAPIAPDESPVFVFVFAHPDDESMFFLPTIRSLVDEGQKVWFLCLTTGNYNGLGKIRETEMQKAGKLLGASGVIVRNDDVGGGGSSNGTKILDHPTNRWDKTVVAKAIRESLLSKLRSHRMQERCCGNRFVLITFDAIGVSGHANHTDTHRGVRHLMEEERNRRRTEESTATTTKTTTTTSKTETKDAPSDDDLLLLEAWYLESERNVLFKYVPAVSWVLLLVSFVVSKIVVMSSVLAGVGEDAKTARVYRMHNPTLNWKSMATHRSQFVWYRRLFVVFSCYTYYNKLLCDQPSRRKTIPSETNKKI